MRKWAAFALIAVYLLALLVRLSPLARTPFFGSDAGEYYRIALDLSREGHVSLDYDGWGVTYPWFPGMFFLVDGLALAGLDLPTALNLAIPALGALIVLPVFLIVAPRARDERAALAAAAIVASIMPHAYPTAHAIPATVGDLLVFSILAMALRARADRRWAGLIALAVPALVVTHHLSMYFLGIALLTAFLLRSLLNPTVPVRELAREAGVLAYVFGSAFAFWFGYATPWRDLIASEATLRPWWLLFGLLAAGVLVAAALIRVRRRLTALRYRPAAPSLAHSVTGFAAGLAAVFVVIGVGTLAQVPGTTITLSPLAAVWFVPVFVLIAFSSAGRRAVDFARDGVDVTGWFLAFVLSVAAGALLAPRALIPYRHVEYIVVPLAILAGVGFVRTLDLGGIRGWSRAAAAVGFAVLVGTAAAGAIPPPSLLANYDEGFSPRAFDAAFWAREHVPAGALVAADHRESSVLFGFGRVDATWDRARATFLATTFADARSEMAALTTPSGKTLVEYVLLDANAVRGLQLFPWEPAYPLDPAAVAKFDEPPFVKVFDSGYAEMWWVNWGSVG